MRPVPRVPRCSSLVSELWHLLCFFSSSDDSSLQSHLPPPGHLSEAVPPPPEHPTLPPTHPTPGPRSPPPKPSIPRGCQSSPVVAALGNPNLNPWHRRHRPTLIYLPTQWWRPCRRLAPSTPLTASATIVTPAAVHHHLPLASSPNPIPHSLIHRGRGRAMRLLCGWPAMRLERGRRQQPGPKVLTLCLNYNSNFFLLQK
jgi:hypothetical protein